MGKKIKVMAMISNLSDGGAQRVLLNHAKLFKDNDDIDFVVYSFEKPQNAQYEKEVVENDLSVVYLKRNSKLVSVPVLGEIINTIYCNYIWLKAINECNPDIIHLHVTEIYRKCFLALFLKRNIKKFGTLHSNPYRYRGLPLLCAKFSFHVANVIPICITAEQAEMASKHYGVSKYKIIRNGVDLEKIEDEIVLKSEARLKFGINQCDFIVGTVGRLDEIKNYPFLLDVFSIVQAHVSNSKLLIAGDGPQKEALVNYAKELNILDKVVFLGNIGNVIEFDCALDTFCMTSISEASPMALIEAQCCKLHCVVSQGVTIDNFFNDNIMHMTNSSTTKEWADAIMDVSASNVIPMRKKQDFGIRKTYKDLKKLYTAEY